MWGELSWFIRMGLNYNHKCLYKREMKGGLTTEKEKAL